MLRLADGAGGTWAPALDLIGAAPTEQIFVAEVNDQGIAGLRINSAAGAATLSASSTGSATAQPVTPRSKRSTCSCGRPAGIRLPLPGKAPGLRRPGGISLIRNPLAAAGGIDAETISAAKLAIPGAFLAGEQRALTATDYATLATAVPGFAVPPR